MLKYSSFLVAEEREVKVKRVGGVKWQELVLSS